MATHEEIFSDEAVLEGGLLEMKALGDTKKSTPELADTFEEYLEENADVEWTRDGLRFEIAEELTEAERERAAQKMLGG